MDTAAIADTHNVDPGLSTSTMPETHQTSKRGIGDNGDDDDDDNGKDADRTKGKGRMDDLARAVGTSKGKCSEKCDKCGKNKEMTGEGPSDTSTNVWPRGRRGNENVIGSIDKVLAEGQETLPNIWPRGQPQGWQDPWLSVPTGPEESVAPNTFEQTAAPKIPEQSVAPKNPDENLTSDDALRRDVKDDRRALQKIIPRILRRQCERPGPSQSNITSPEDVENLDVEKKPATAMKVLAKLKGVEPQAKDRGQRERGSERSSSSGMRSLISSFLGAI